MHYLVKLETPKMQCYNGIPPTKKITLNVSQGTGACVLLICLITDNFLLRFCVYHHLCWGVIRQGVYETKLCHGRPAETLDANLAWLNRMLQMTGSMTISDRACTVHDGARYSFIKGSSANVNVIWCICWLFHSHRQKLHFVFTCIFGISRFTR